MISVWVDYENFERFYRGNSFVGWHNQAEAKEDINIIVPSSRIINYVRSNDGLKISFTEED